MKKNYEKKELLYFMIIVFLFFQMIICSLYLKEEYRTYKSISAIVITDYYIKTYVDNQSLQKLKQSKYFYVDNKRLKYEIINIEKNVLKKDEVSFHEVMIKFQIPKKYKDNDTFRISIFSDKKEIYTMFKKCWESE